MAIRFTRSAGNQWLSRTSGMLNAAAGGVYSLCFWAKLSSDPNDYHSFVSLRPITDNTGDMLQCIGDGVTPSITVGQGGYTEATGSALTVGTWAFLAMVRESNTVLKLYQGASTTTASLTATNTADITGRAATFMNALGRTDLNNFQGEYLDGVMAAFLSWDAALTLAEIQAQQYYRSPVRTTNLHDWNPMFAGATERTANYAGNSNAWTQNGTLTDEDGPPVVWSLAPWTVAPLVTTAGGYSITAAQGSYTLTGQTTGLRATRLMAAVQGSYTMTGQASLLKFGRLLSAVQGSYTLSGQTTGLLVTRLMSASQGSYTLNGQAAGLLFGRLLTANQGGYSLSGQAVAFLIARLIAANQGSYTLNGQAAALLVARLIAANQGSYTLNGQDVTLTYTPAGGYALSCNTGTYTLSGQTIGLLTARLMSANQGGYVLSGQAANLLVGHLLAANQGGYSVSGQAANLVLARLMSAGMGSYTLDGRVVTLIWSGEDLPITPDSRVYVVPTEDRLYVVVFEERIVPVDSETRVLVA